MSQPAFSISNISYQRGTATAFHEIFDPYDSEINSLKKLREKEKKDFYGAKLSN